MIIAVGLVQIDFLAGGHVKVAGRQLVFRVFNCNYIDGGFDDLYDVVLVVVVFDAQIRRYENGIYKYRKRKCPKPTDLQKLLEYLRWT